MGQTSTKTDTKQHKQPPPFLEPNPYKSQRHQKEELQWLWVKDLMQKNYQRNSTTTHKWGDFVCLPALRLDASYPFLSDVKVVESLKEVVGVVM